MLGVTKLQMSLLTDDLAYGEGPRWHDGRLWFSDMFRDRICTLDGSTGAVTVVTEFPHPSGLGFLSDGSLIAVSVSENRVYRLKDAELAVVADLSGDDVLMINDMVVSARDDIYVGRVYGEMAGGSPIGEVVRVRPDGAVDIVATDIATPNAIGILPDDRTLLVNLTSGEGIEAFDIKADGTLSNRRVWASLPGRFPDGMSVDEEGAVWIGSYATGEFLRVLEGGTITHRMETPGLWAVAPMLGGTDRRTLFLFAADTDLEDRFPRSVASGKVYTATVDVPGAGRP
jgi:sugar lactone lactonase YvrE